MDCLDCPGATCPTYGGEGTVPDWLADPAINGEAAARTWGWQPTT